MKKVLGLVLALVSSVAFSAALAQSWPQRPVKFICPLGPGSGADITGRLLADRLSKRWGQPVVFENRPGGEGVIAINAVIAANDDHTLLYGPSSSFVGHPYQLEKIPYDPRELQPVARVSSTVVVIAVPSSLNVNSLKDLVAMVRAQPGKMNWSSITGVTDIVIAGYLKGAGHAAGARRRDRRAGRAPRQVRDRARHQAEPVGHGLCCGAS
jgi:tripartite-type tricarboxylate transporter receptor subunit TctC